jgi:hypothetical protein
MGEVAKGGKVLMGELAVGEPHPAANSAMEYISSMDMKDLVMWLESFASCAIEGNRLAEICSETLHRMMQGKPVSDRYVLGLAWTLMKKDLKNPNFVMRDGKWYDFQVTDGKFYIDGKEVK